MNAHISPHTKPSRLGRRCHRSGTTMIELVVSAMLLVTVMTFVTTLAFRVGLIWKDTGHHRLAMNELSNQLEVLTSLNPDQIPDALKEVQPSPMVIGTLDQPELSGDWLDDELGRRIVLRLNWQRRNPGKPVTLVGWVSNPGAPNSDKSIGVENPSDAESAP